MGSYVELIDTLQFGRSRTGAAYHVCGEKHALVDAGTSLSLAAVQEGLGKNSLDYVLLTHIHPDHAGAAGALARLFPNARIGVHERGAAHLMDPSKLNASVRAFTGSLATLYGEVQAVPPERIWVVKHGDLIDLGKGIVLEAIDAPGHAPHHLCFYERSHRGLFCGDALGIYREGILVPSTVPPSFHLGKSLTTVTHLSQYHPDTLFYAHFGMLQGTPEVFDQYVRCLVDWVKRIDLLRQRASEDQVVHTILADRRFAGFDRELRLELTMCIRGALHYLRLSTAES